MVGCKKCADRKEEIAGLRWDVKDLEAEIYEMKKPPCRMGGCKMVWRHSESGCYWMNPEIDQLRMKVHEAEMRVDKLVNHINDYNLGFGRLDAEGFVQRNITKVKVGNGYAEIEYIF